MNSRIRMYSILSLLLAVSVAVSAQNPLSPSDDWVGAMRQGGQVILGPGAFVTTDYVELTNSVTVRGQGVGVTSLWFDSDGGEFGEQLVLLAEGDTQVRFEFSDLDIAYGGDISTDLIVMWGPAQLSLSNASVSYAWEDADFLDTNPNFFRGSGLVLGEESTALVDSVTFYLNGSNGITANWGKRLVVSNSSFYDNWWSGIYVLDTPLTVSGSHFELNSVGIEIYGSATRILSQNTFVDQYFEDVYEGGSE